MEKEKFISKVSLEAVLGCDRNGTWSRKDEEYVADFTLLSRRVLSEPEYRLFRYHFLLGADWKLCCKKLNVDRGTFFHMVYRIQQKLGRVFSEVEPYALYPVEEYFHGPLKDVAPVLYDVKRVVPIRPPIRQPGSGELPRKKVA